MSCCTSSTSATATLTRLGLVDLDLLAIEGHPIHLADRRVGGLLLVEGHEGITLAGVVDVRHSSELLELGLFGKITIKHTLIRNSGSQTRKSNCYQNQMSCHYKG